MKTIFPRCLARLASVLLALAVAVAVAAAAAPAVASEDGSGIHFRLRSFTLMTRDVTPGYEGGTFPKSPTLQFLTLGGSDLNGTGVYGELSAWMLQDLSDRGPASSEHFGDIAYGIVGWQNASQTLKVQAGRQVVFSGATRFAYLDGVSVVSHLPGDLKVEAYGGTIAYEGFEHEFSSLIWGGRLAWIPWEIGHVALAYQHSDGEEGLERHTAGADFALRGVGPVLWTGSYAHDLITGGLAEARLDGTWTVNKHLSLYARGELRDPIAWLPRTSIFLAFVDRTDGIAGGGFDLRTPGALSVAGGYEHFLYSDGFRDGFRTFLDLRLRIDEAGRYRAGVVTTRLDNGDNGFLGGRAYASARIADAWHVACDVDAVMFDHDVRGYDRSVTGSVATRWTATEGFLLGVDAQVWSNPFFEKQASAQLSLTLTDALFRRGHHVAGTAAAGAGADAGETKDADEEAGDDGDAEEEASDDGDGDKSDGDGDGDKSDGDGDGDKSDGDKSDGDGDKGDGDEGDGDGDDGDASARLSTRAPRVAAAHVTEGGAR